MTSSDRPARGVWLAVLVAALGYFVDIYDLILFSVVRTASLTSLGVTGDDLTTKSKLLIDAQMYGMLVGGILWGILGDKRGRLSVLFGSILMYSLANLANAWVQDVPTYAILRFIAGVGLAGELGAGVTLVAEVLPPHRRGWGTTIVAGVGLFGALLASVVSEIWHWRTAYVIGGVMGLALLVLRIGIFESGMFEKVKGAVATRGDFFMLFTNSKRFLRYAGVVLIGVPIWYVVGILVTFSPEIAKSLGMDPLPKTADAVFWCYFGLALGDLSSGALSQVLKGRRRVVLLFLLLSILAYWLYFEKGAASLAWFKTACFACGFASGYWAVFVTLAAEQFGTNIRATVATTAPNFVRGTVPLLTTMFFAWRPDYGPDRSAMLVGAISLAIAFLALTRVHETYGKDLDYVE